MDSRKLVAGLIALVVPWGLVAQGVKLPAKCHAALLEGEVEAGKSYERVFAPGLKFLLEPIRSGWMARVLQEGKPREAHDLAELATPPYASVTPLAVTTDFSFRAQDAVAWNPRRFHYAAAMEDFRRMSALYGPAVAGDARAAGELARLAAGQPEGTLTILDAHLVPGTSDQAQMAAMVASHFANTPHEVDQGPPSTLGRVTWMRFRVELELTGAQRTPRGVTEIERTCSVQPTTPVAVTSDKRHPVVKK